MQVCHTFAYTCKRVLSLNLISVNLSRLHLSFVIFETLNSQIRTGLKRKCKRPVNTAQWTCNGQFVTCPLYTCIILHREGMFKRVQGR